MPPRVSRDICAAEIRRLVGDSPTIVEVGCNDGTHTKWFLDEMSGARIWCFEPDPRPLVRFREHVGGDHRVTVLQAALSDVDGETTFYCSGGEVPKTSVMPVWWRGSRTDWDESGSLLAPKDHLTVSPWVTFAKRIPVATIRLDTWSAVFGVTKVDFIHADTQGAEHLMIAGGLRTLANTGYLYTEFADRELYVGQKTLRELFVMLAGVMEPRGIYSNNVLFKGCNQ